MYISITKYKVALEATSEIVKLVNEEFAQIPRKTPGFRQAVDADR